MSVSRPSWAYRRAGRNPRRGTFSDWRLGAPGWTLAQTIEVTIPYGSSG
jgi:hypothetical protein